MWLILWLNNLTWLRGSERDLQWTGDWGLTGLKWSLRDSKNRQREASGLSTAITHTFRQTYGWEEGVTVLYGKNVDNKNLKRQNAQSNKLTMKTKIAFLHRSSCNNLKQHCKVHTFNISDKTVKWLSKHKAFMINIMDQAVKWRRHIYNICMLRYWRNRLNVCLVVTRHQIWRKDFQCRIYFEELQSETASKFHK